MDPYRTLIRLGSVVAAGSLMFVAVSEAAACGGFFCNASTLSPIYQGGERVLFAKHGDRVTMHVEVTYVGDPTTFGWLLPVPEIPTDDLGNQVPLEETVQISSGRLFSRLQSETDPVFRVKNDWSQGYYDCQDDYNYLWFDSASSDDAGVSGGGDPPPVVVLQEAEVGPYNAQMIQAANTDALMEWLEANNYYQDPASEPLLDHYLGEGFLFLGIKLQSGKGTGDLKPLALTFGEEAPCVPLRLTAIAATPDMPILVWVLGEGRAIPKNFIHALVNDRAIEFPGGGNYIDVVTEAVDTVAGRAWVTEFSGAASQFMGDFISTKARDTSALEAADSLLAILDAVKAKGVPQDADYQDILMDEVPMPDELMGYPYGNCYYDPNWQGTSGGGGDSWGGDDGWGWYGGCPDNDTHVTTEPEFYNYLRYYAELAAAGEMELDVDVDRLAGRIIDEIIMPLGRIEDLFTETTTLTRFFTTQGPTEMTRDPVFAFNGDLPAVSNVHELVTLIDVDEDCNPYVDATYADGTRHIFDCDYDCFMATLGPVPGAPALSGAEVLDEWGEPIPFDPAQAGEIDALLGFATPGERSLPADFAVTPPPPGGLDDTVGPIPDVGSGGSGGSSDSGWGCQAVGGSAAWLLLALCGLAIVGFVRRRNGVITG